MGSFWEAGCVRREKTVMLWFVCRVQSLFRERGVGRGGGGGGGGGVGGGRGEVGGQAFLVFYSLDRALNSRDPT